MARPPALPGGRRADLHTHSHFSDGTLAPEGLVALALERGLAALSITDHDTLEGLAPARIAAGSTLELVPGIEISSAHAGGELHLLGYYVDPLHEPLLERLTHFRAERLERALEILGRLERLGMRIEASEVLAAAGPGVVGRPHIASILLQAGHVESIDDAFRRYLGRQGTAFVPRPAFRTEEAIELVHEAGGVSVLAHPGAVLSDAQLEGFVDLGLKGIEVWHPHHNPTTVRRLRTLASRLELIETGGSDYHGAHRSVELGEFTVNARVLARLKEVAGVAG